MSEGVRAMWMRGGTSKGGFFLATDLPADTAARDAFLLRAYGSPDLRQIDGMGGADPLTSKVAVVSRSARDDADVDYLFLQVSVDQARVSDAQNCGNLLAGVGPFALERGLLPAQDGQTAVRIFMRNTGTVATATVCTPGGQVTYAGDTRIDGVPGTAAPIALAFAEIAGSSCGALLPTGNPVDLLDGIAVTLIDNGMPCVVLRASDVGIRGDEDRATLDADVELRARLETLRLQAGPLMRLGDVATATVPKLMLVSAPATVARSRCARSFRIAAMPPSACWARSPWPPPACCPARRRTRWHSCRAAPRSSWRSSTPAVPAAASLHWTRTATWCAPPSCAPPANCSMGCCLASQRPMPFTPADDGTAGGLMQLPVPVHSAAQAVPSARCAACSGYRLRKRAYVGTCRSRAPGCSGCKQPRDAHVPSHQTTR